MSDSSRSTSDSTATAERLLGALGSAAAGLGTREALTELGDRARGVVEELARHARRRREAAEAASAAARDAAEPQPSSEEPERGSSSHARRGFSALSSHPELHRRLDDLRACLGEVGDVLEATVERLGTIEGQLGDPDFGVETMLREGVERCERVLAGIEHRVVGLGSVSDEGAGRPSALPATKPSRPIVVVAVASSARRARICVALEGLGLRVVAATGADAARAAALRWQPSAVLLDVDCSLESTATFLEEWREGESRGSLPPAAVLGGEGREVLGFPVIREEFGEAAMAASLLALAGATGARADERNGE